MPEEEEEQRLAVNEAVLFGLFDQYLLMVLEASLQGCPDLPEIVEAARDVLRDGLDEMGMDLYRG